MNYAQLFEQIQKKKSFLCVGLDTDINKIPSFLKELDDPVFEFNKRIIDATNDLVIAYKPNLAFYESLGLKGWEAFEKTVDYINSNYPEILIIADAKRGDIGNTSKMYAKAFFEILPCDAVTVAPYMGSDSVKPFLEIENKWVVILALTSNQGAFDFQFSETNEGKIYEKVLNVSKTWGTSENTMYVVGATKAEELSNIRNIIPDHFLLVPGVGAQGGSLAEVAKYGLNKSCGLIVNSSRAIIYADSTENFDKIAREKAIEVQQEMKALLDSSDLL
jgi:orotidine-5'-phosphate decarboxylase